MKTKKLIKELKKSLKKNGNLEVLVYDTFNGHEWNAMPIAWVDLEGGKLILQSS